jgi:DNA-binding transcriptional LysR family regulator
MDTLNEMRLFTEVVRTGSFAAAGRKLGVAPSSMTRQVNALERELGARLLNRTTRKLSLTEAGQLYYGEALRILSKLEDAKLAVSQLQESPRGTLRLSAPVAFGRLHVAPALTQFLTRFPDMRVDLIATDQVLDMVDAGIDVALRMGRLADSSLVARKLAPNRFVVCASPAYIERHGAPQRPQDLASCNCLTYKWAPGPVTWTFEGPHGLARIEVSGNLEADSLGALKAAACRGLGLVLLPLWSATPCLKSGELQVVLSDYAATARDFDTEEAIYAVYPHRKQIPPKVRAFLDYMVEYVGDPPYWELE